MKHLILIIALSFLAACAKKPQAALPSDSVYNLDAIWQNQDGERMQLRDLSGKNVVLAMIYTNCTTACPILISDMKGIEKKINPARLRETALVLVSIDPERDTPEKLKAFAEAYKMTDPQWLFLRGSTADTQTLANVVAMKYKKISPMEFSHSNIITILNINGQIAAQQEGAAIDAGAAATVLDTLR